MKKITLYLTLFFAFTTYAQNCPTTIGSQSSTTSVHFNVTPSECNTYPATITVDGILCTNKSCQGSNLKYVPSSPLPSADTFSVDFGNGVVCVYSNGALVTLSTESFAYEDSLSVFPNPVTNDDSITVNFTTKREFKTELYSILGSLIRTQNSNSDFDKIDVSNLNNGIYLLKIITSDFSISKKIIIKR